MSRVRLRVRASFAVLLASVGVAVHAAEVRSPDGQFQVGHHLRVPLDFLDPKARCVAEIYRDGPLADWKTRPHELVVEKRNVTAAEMLELALASSGGAAIRFKQAR